MPRAYRRRRTPRSVGARGFFLNSLSAHADGERRGARSGSEGGIFRGIVQTGNSGAAHTTVTGRPPLLQRLSARSDRHGSSASAVGMRRGIGKEKALGRVCEVKALLHGAVGDLNRTLEDLDIVSLINTTANDLLPKAFNEVP